ncbi:MAG: hypothetical protein ABIR62_12495 [Dokdonella sp.]|uniref:hypothetical protein n=1 Tax=Dokdonella sp. TaxID=2291710 RepID=UPI003266B16D
MAVTSSPIDVPSVDALRLAQRFERRNRLSACRGLEPAHRILLLAVAATAFIVVAAAGYRFCTSASWWLDPLRTHAPVVALAAAWVVRSRVERVRRVIEQRFASSWLAAAPILSCAIAGMVQRRAASELLIMIGMSCGLIAAAGAINAVPVWNVIAAVVAGAIPGALLGWWSAARPPRVRAENHVRIARRQADRGTTIGLGALGRWAFAERIARLRPRMEARVFGAVLFSMPMGIPPLTAVLLLLSLAVAVIATTLLIAQLAIVPRAADWLRTTPLAARTLTISSGARTCAWQCVYTVAMAAVLAALGTDARTILAIATGWFAWVAASTLTAFAVRHRKDRVRIEIFALATVLAALASIAVPLALVAAAIVAVVQWKRAEAA